jgi:hypothetical protein
MTKAYIRLKPMVGTTNKSMAAMSGAKYVALREAGARCGERRASTAN